MLRTLLAATLLLTGCATTSTKDPAIAIESLGADERTAVLAAIESAGPNGDELRRALAEIEPERREGMAFLIATMPERDRTSLSSEFLVTNVRLAYDAWEKAPWGDEVSKEHFLRYILPYANLNERRDDWRADFVERFQAAAWTHPTRIDAVRWLNDSLNDAVGVHYHASKRMKPDQSPYESIELGWASCTGLSILLVDACRAAGIPARCVGCPAWKVVVGNHTWVEVFVEDGAGGERWFNVGGTGSDPRDGDWVNERCREETDPDDWAHAVYAAVWAPTDRHFPLPWEWEIDYVPARNVTRFYRDPVDVVVPLDAPGPALVEALWHDEVVARVRVPEGAREATFRLAAGEEFEFRRVEALR